MEWMVEDKTKSLPPRQKIGLMKVYQLRALKESHELYGKLMKCELQVRFDVRKNVEQLKERHRKAKSEALQHFTKAVDTFDPRVKMIGPYEDTLIEMIQASFLAIQYQNFCIYFHIQIEEMINSLASIYEKYLKEQVVKVKLLNEVSQFVSDAQIFLEQNYRGMKLQIVVDYLRLALKFDVLMEEQTILEQLVDDYYKNRSAIFKRHEASFEADILAHLKTEKLKATIANTCKKHQQANKKWNEERRRILQQLKDVQEQLADEKAKRKHLARNLFEGQEVSLRAADVSELKEMVDNGMSFLKINKTDVQLQKQAEDPTEFPERIGRESTLTIETLKIMVKELKSLLISSGEQLDYQRKEMDRFQKSAIDDKHQRQFEIQRFRKEMENFQNSWEDMATELKESCSEKMMKIFEGLMDQEKIRQEADEKILQIEAKNETRHGDWDEELKKGNFPESWREPQNIYELDALEAPDASFGFGKSQHLLLD